MKLNKILPILILITVLFVSISAISAEPISDETVIADGSSQNDGDSVNYYVSDDGSDSNDGSQSSPFKTIGKAVEKTSANKTTNIYLADGIYQGDGNVNLTMASNINLIGTSVDNTILDGSNANWLANMTNGVLNIKALTIKNFFLTINKTGTNAGIITSDSDVNLDNVIISDNIIKTVLGADEEKSTIYTGVLLSTGKITISNVVGFNNLINNTQGTTLADLRKLADWGCVICSFDSARVDNSYFYNNKGSRSSVVYAHTLSTLDVMNSVFVNNTATYCGGVFLSYLNTTTHISNSYFKKNNGTNAGGIIYQQRYCNMYVDDCIFEDNYANTGGSLYAHHYSNLTATNCSFSTGRARTGSAIIGADFVILNVSDCVFDRNTASEGAIMGDEGCQMIVDNCVFTNNVATFGAAVFGDMINDISVSNSLLVNNSATYGGAIFGTFETTVTITNNTFVGNTAVNGSVVFVDNTGKLDEEPETPARDGITSEIISEENTYINNTSEDNLLIVNYGEPVNYYVSPQGSDSNNGTQDSPFKTIAKAVEKATEYKITNIFLAEGIYQGEGNVNLTVPTGIILVGVSPDKTILDGSNANWLAKVNDGVLFIKNLTIQNFFLTIDKTGTNAGIITSDSEVILDTVVISDNTIKTVLGAGEEKSTIYTGVLLSTGKITINNVVGFNNLINNTQGTTLADLRKLADWGCVICSFDAATINNSYFYNNKGSRSSVVYAHTLSTLDVMNSVFVNNTATYCGGVFLSYLNTTTHISNSYFKKNNGTNAGGIIYQQRYCNMYVDDCIFEDNYANTGGSLYAHHYSNLTATNCSFSTGRARTGSAIIGADFVILNVSDCVFDRNTASEGAIMGDEGCQMIVDNCVFTNNVATFGAAVFGDMINDISVTNSLLVNNSATYGGAIFGTFETIVKIINNTFVDNSAVNGSIVFVDNTGKLDEEPETPAYDGITSAIYSKDNIYVNNTSEDNLLIVNYETENNPVLKDTQIIVSDVTTTVYIKSIDGNKKSKVIITLKDNEGNVLSNKELTIVLNGEILTQKTDENGTSTVEVAITKAGTYDCVVSFAGDKNYKSSIAASKVVVNKKTAKLIVKKATFKVKAKTKSYSVTLKDASTSKVLAKKQVTIKINNKTYKATTNSKGVAKINVKLTKKGTYKATVTFNGDSFYKKVSKTGTIIIK
ncbi:DUF1565 domain-containing protein [Methanobrevibacter sp.]|uniref:DUF1565 domain-containing protein n=1 Tax=Methanobrevibacter sp. TaxID=66852 RepID=UPI0025E226C9|nr:DUF1565 domain-containing protein [Methanobrevibacter sp.]MBQ2832017.1 DUF1565 domain-containing protein [Methanobrevibacter sp.]